MKTVSVHSGIFSVGAGEIPPLGVHQVAGDMEPNLEDIGRIEGLHPHLFI